MKKQALDRVLRESMSLVKDDQQRLSVVIENELAVEMEYIAHHTFDTEAGYLRALRG